MGRRRKSDAHRELIAGQNLGERLRHEREAAGLSQGELASKVGLGWQQSDVSRRESGEYEITGEEIKSICSTLGITVARFFGEHVSPTAAA